MAIPHIAHTPGHWTASAPLRALTRLVGSPAVKALGTLLLLVVIGMATGQLVGHVLAAGIEKLLDLAAVGQSG